MSIIEVQVPQLSESVAEGTLATWKKKIGDSVARDEILVDIETDKVSVFFCTHCALSSTSSKWN